MLLMGRFGTNKRVVLQGVFSTTVYAAIYMIS
jgi:hypothetical protein